MQTTNLSKTSSEHSENFVRLEREKKISEELLQQQVQQLESENALFTSENEKLRLKADKVNSLLYVVTVYVQT